MKIIEDIKSFNQNVKEKFDSRYIYAYLCFLYSLLRFGASPKDFFRYEFYKKSNYERNKFTTWLRSKKIISKLNKGNIAVYENKVLFNQLFQEYIKRKWLDLSTCTFEEFYDFLKQYQSIIIKPVDGGSGRGIQKIKFELYEKNELREYFDQHRTCIAEEVIIQHELMSKLNPNSVNTIRVLTITNKDNVEIVQCSLRTGGGESIVDNLHANGVVANVDIETGLVDYPAVDNKSTKYLYHPYSHEQIVGFKVPNWNQLKAEIIKIATITPDVKYVGWDIAVLNAGIELIEGNHDPAHELTQMINQNGNYKTIRNVWSKR